MRGEVAAAGPGFYGASEYDLTPIAASGRASVELGRSCVAREHRGGPGMHLLWNGLAAYVLERDIELLFGVASFHGTDPAPLAEALSYLHYEHLAPPDLRVRAHPEHYLEMNLMARADDRPDPGAARHPAADQGLPAARRLRRRGGLRRRGLQHHRRVRGHGHRADDRALPAVLPARPRAARLRGAPVRAGWNEVEPPALPPMSAGERLRLVLRARLGAGGALRALRGLPAAARHRPRRSSGWRAGRSAGSATASCGSGRRRRCRRSGSPTSRAAGRCGAAGPSSPTTRAGSTSWRCSGRRRRSWCPRPRCGRWPGVGPIGRAIGTMFIDRRPAEAKRQEAVLLARLSRGDQMALFPEGTSTDGLRVLPFKSTLFGAFFAPGLRQGRRRPAGDDRLPAARRPAGELLRLVGRDGLREPRPRRAGALDRRRRGADLPPAARRSPTSPTARRWRRRPTRRCAPGSRPLGSAPSDGVTAPMSLS